ncbi:MAG: tRNA pseudouridine(13) synthase TruD [Nitrososphaerales archaeon]
MNVPSIDAAIGMEVYSTDIDGIGGAIKQNMEQFFVEELLYNGLLDLSSDADEEHEYPIYILQKEGIDSNHAITEVKIATGLKLKVVGLKDAKAITRQYVGSVRKCSNATPCIVTRHCVLHLLGYTRKPITKANLVGNRFTISVTGSWTNNLEQTLIKFEKIISENRIANFYGYQRFGGSRAVTHLVGREIIRRNFKSAVEIFLSYPSMYDRKEIAKIRAACMDSSNIPHILKIMPKQMDLERILLQELAASNDPFRAIRRLPVTIRRLFVQAYQSYLFNRSLSIAIKRGYDTAVPTDGDICFNIANNRVIGIKRFARNDAYVQVPAIPMVGYAFRDDNKFSSIVKQVMSEENISKDDFYVREMQEVSVEGGLRQASLFCNDFSYTLNESLKLQFGLCKGCYATVLLRELMKPTDPIAAGF